MKRIPCVFLALWIGCGGGDRSLPSGDGGGAGDSGNGDGGACQIQSDPSRALPSDVSFPSLVAAGDGYRLLWQTADYKRYRMLRLDATGKAQGAPTDLDPALGSHRSRS